MKDCFAYIRVSTVKQGEQGVSLQEQRSAIERYAANKNFNITHWFEESVTAAKRGRPIFTSMMKRLRKKEVEAVIIHKIDRSARNLSDWAALGELNDAGVEFHFAVESLDLSSRNGRLAADMLAVVAADFVRNLRNETIKGFYGRLKQGLYPLPAPLGYLDCGRGIPKKPDPKFAPVIAQAFKLYATGDYSLRSLRKKLKMTGRGGKQISLNGLSKILNNPFYYGVIYIRSRDEFFKGIHPPIITKAVFDDVQSVLKGKCGAKITKHNFIFKRLFKCAVCGYFLIGEKQKGRVYYRCHTKGCPTTGIREDVLEEHILALFAQIQIPQRFSSYLCDHAKTKWSISCKNQAQNEKTSALNVAKIDEKLERLTDAYVNGVIDQKVLNEKRISLLIEKEQHEAQVKKNPNSAILRHWLTDFLELLKSLILTYEEADDDKKRKIIKQATSNRVVIEKNVELEPSPHWAYMQKANSVLTGDPSQGNSRTFDAKEIEKICHKILKDLENIFKEQRDVK